MRRSFEAMGGGGGMMRTVHRAVRAGSGSHGSPHPHEPFSHSTINNKNNNNSNTLSFSSNHHPYPFISSVDQYDDDDDDDDDDDFVFSTVPSMDEVHHAISSLQQVVSASHDSGWDLELDWIEPSTSMLKAHCGGSESVFDAFRLLQTEPSVERMVLSLSSDKSVWEAVMNNEVVRELRDSIYEGDKSVLGNEAESSDGPTPIRDVLQWILINTKTKLMEIVKKTTEMMNKLFQSSINEKIKDEEAATFETKLKSCFCLSVMVLLIVVVTRSYKY